MSCYMNNKKGAHVCRFIYKCCFFVLLKLPASTNRILEADGIYLNVFSGLKTHPGTVCFGKSQQKND